MCVSSIRHPTGGSFVRPKKASFGEDYVTALKQRYEVELQEVIGEELRISSKTVMMVGFEDVKQKQRRGLGLSKKLNIHKTACINAAFEF